MGGDGVITVDEFIKGVSILKGQSRSYDVIKIQREIEKLAMQVGAMQMGLGLMTDKPNGFLDQSPLDIKDAPIGSSEQHARCIHCGCGSSDCRELRHDAP